MPNLITHALFARDVMQAVNAPDWVQARQHLLEIGANGPDFLFFAGLSPKGLLEGDMKLNKIGSRLHAGDVNAFYNSALDSILQEKNPEIRRDMEAYVIGHLCHWALDSTVHPYVYYRTGKYTGRSGWYHHRLESILDAALLKKKTGQSIKEFYYPNIAAVSPKEARAIAHIYIPAAEELYNEQITPHGLYETLSNWNRLQRLWYDPNGRKLKTLRTLEKLTGRQNNLSGFLIPVESGDEHDVLNERHALWRHPVSGEYSTMSFEELYASAIERARTAIHLFELALENPEARAAFLEFLGDRNYESGLPENPRMEVFDVETFPF